MLEAFLAREGGVSVMMALPLILRILSSSVSVLVASVLRFSFSLISPDSRDALTLEIVLWES